MEILMRFAGLLVGAALTLGANASAQTLPPPSATDPVQLGIMVGSPAPPNARVTRSNILQYPNARWAFRNMRALYPTHNVEAPSFQSELPVDRSSLEGLSFTNAAGATLTFDSWRDATYTDALIVLRNGRIVYEYYAPGMSARQPHALWSMSKSVVGILAQIEISSGRLDPAAKVGVLVPELASTAWSQVSVQQLLDMQSGVDYRENFADRRSDLYRYLFSTGLIDVPASLNVSTTLSDYLPTVRPGTGGGSSFAYRSVDSEVLGWVLARTTGQQISALVSDRLWRPLGTESDGYYLIDPAGMDIASVGMNATLRDMARLGVALANDGRIGRRRVFPSGLTAQLREGVDRAIFAASASAAARPGYGYRNQWWIPNDVDGVIEAKGLFGQHLYVNPAQQVVIVKFSSHPVGDTGFTHASDRPAFSAIAAHISPRADVAR